MRVYQKHTSRLSVVNSPSLSNRGHGTFSPFLGALWRAYITRAGTGSDLVVAVLCWLTFADGERSSVTFPPISHPWSEPPSGHAGARLL